MKKMPNVIQQAISEVLLPNGFQRKGKSWYRATEETVLFVGLQKSNFGQQFYINLGVLVRKLSDNPQPRENECHIATRLKNLSRIGSRIEESLDLENTAMPEEQRMAILESSLQAEGLTFLQDFETVARIQDTLGKRKYQGLAVWKEVYNL